MLDRVKDKRMQRDKIMLGGETRFKQMLFRVLDLHFIQGDTCVFSSFNFAALDRKKVTIIYSSKHSVLK